MNQSQYSKLFSFLFNIANDVLVQAFEKGDYKKVTLPFIVLRRLDLLLEATKDRVIRFAGTEEFSRMPEDSQEQQLCQITGFQFYNLSPFTMKLLRAETDSTRLRQNFFAYLDGFSRHVQDIISKFDLRHYVEKLSSVNRLGLMIEKMTDATINLGVAPVMESVTNPQTGKEELVEKLPALDNHTMGTLFEDLLRKFNEDYSVTEAGEHYTPRDYVRLLADLAILPVAPTLHNQRYSIYDGACGTGGILSLVQDRIEELSAENGKRWTTELYGQEIQPETFAICKADLMLSGNSTSFTYRQGGLNRLRFANGSTISEDGHPGKKFHFCISNPPFGTPWKADLENWGFLDNKRKSYTNAKAKINDPRFFGRMDGATLRFVPEVSDTQMLFLANNMSRMMDDAQGTRIVEIHNGSSLFSGDAGGGESNLRRYIIENDMLEAIVAMPENMFYNTGIGTFVWIVTNRKEERRRGKVQLIDATAIKTPLRKNLGHKNCEVSESNRKSILKLLMDFEENEQSKIFDNREFGYWQVKVERPLRLRVKPDAELPVGKLKEAEITKCKQAMAQIPADVPLDDWNKYAKSLGLKATLLKKLRPLITEKDATAVAVAGEGDPDLSDDEQIPLLYPGGIEAFMKNEVLPYAPDAWVDEKSITIGYELSFTKYFYKPVELRSRKDILSSIQEIELSISGMLETLKKTEVAQVVTKGLNHDAPMKDSGISWLGKIPAHWDLKRLKSVLVDRNEPNDPVKTDFILSLTNDRGVIPYADKGAVGNKAKEDLTKYKLAYPDDIVLNSMNVHIGSVALSSYFGCVSPVYYMLHVRNPQHSVRYFNYLFQTKELQNDLHKYGKGILDIRMRIPIQALNMAILPVPPTDEQQAIVDYIDGRIAQIDSYITAITEEIEQLKQYKQRLTSDAVTGKIKVFNE